MINPIINSFNIAKNWKLGLMLLLILSFSITNAQEATSEPSFAPLKTTEKAEQLIDRKNFKVIGQTTFTVLFWDIYSSQLLTSSGNYPAKIDDELLFDINYLADISSEDLIKRTIEQWQHLGVPEAIYQSYLPQLKQMWPNIKDGDSLSLLVEQGSSHFYFNERYLGVIDETEFSEIFLSIWLSENTSQPELRDELLGQVAGEP